MVKPSENPPTPGPTETTQITPVGTGTEPPARGAENPKHWDAGSAQCRADPGSHPAREVHTLALALEYLLARRTLQYIPRDFPALWS